MEYGDETYFYYMKNNGYLEYFLNEAFDVNKDSEFIMSILKLIDYYIYYG